MKNLLESVKAAVAVALSTLGTGAAYIIELIPDDIGKVASLSGVVLTCVLIFVHLRKGRVEYEISQLQLRKLRNELGEDVSAD